MTAHQSGQQRTEQRRYKLRQEDFLLLERAGAFSNFVKAELIDGEIIGLNAQYSRHVRVQSLLYRVLADACDRLGTDLQAWIEGSISIADVTMPQPDMLVVRDLPAEGPVPVDRVALVVEVADSSLGYDLQKKPSVYASAGVPEYWVADVVARVIHQHWSPDSHGYRDTRRIAFGDPITAATIAGLTIATSSL